MPAWADFSVTGLATAYVIRQGQLTLNFNISGNTAMDVSAYVYDAAAVAKGFASAALNNSSAPLSIALNQPKA
ncbi:hypothetical protein LP419_21520 [Massilia sp. H-1]|nr:hypothetical protein LP419_21520 [Massilia sp. H-1]